MTDQEIEHIYLRHRSAFLGWSAKQFGLSREDALDIYQEAIVAFIRNVRAGKFVPFASEPSTYLFAIGRNLALNLIRSRNSGRAEEDVVLRIAHPPETDQLHEDEHNAHLISTGMRSLSEKEQEILRLFYAEERSMTEIAEALGYTNADTAKKMKYVAFRKFAARIMKAVAPERAVHVD